MAIAYAKERARVCVKEADEDKGQVHIIELNYQGFTFSVQHQKTQLTMNPNTEKRELCKQSNRGGSQNNTNVRGPS